MGPKPLLDESGSHTVRIDSDRLIQRIVFVCIVTELLIVLLDAFVNHAEMSEVSAIRRLCNITREDSLSNWFSSTQTMAVGLCLWLIFLRVKSLPGSKWTTRGWGLLACFFTFMGIDDASKLHERLGTASKEWFDGAGGDLIAAFPSYSWQITLGPFFVIMGIFMLVFLRRQMDSTALKALTLGGLSCYVVAVGLDYIEGLDDGGPYPAIMEMFSASRHTVEHFSKALEEFIEMFGSTLFLAAFLKKFTQLGQNLNLRFS